MTSAFVSNSAALSAAAANRKRESNGRFDTEALESTDVDLAPSVGDSGFRSQFENLAEGEERHVKLDQVSENGITDLIFTRDGDHVMVKARQAIDMDDIMDSASGGRLGHDYAMRHPSLIEEAVYRTTGGGELELDEEQAYVVSEHELDEEGSIEQLTTNLDGAVPRMDPSTLSQAVYEQLNERD